LAVVQFDSDVEAQTIPTVKDIIRLGWNRRIRRMKNWHNSYTSSLSQLCIYLYVHSCTYAGIGISLCILFMHACIFVCIH